MSGSGSSHDYGGGSSGGGEEGFDCYMLIERAQLSSPVPEVVEKLQEGTLLDVQLNEGSVPTLHAVHDGTVAGSLIPSKMTQLIACIRSGVNYQATALSIDGGSVTLEIRPTK